MRVPLRTGIPIVALSAGIGAAAGVLLPFSGVRHSPTKQVSATSTSASLPPEAGSSGKPAPSVSEEYAEKTPAIDTAVERRTETVPAMAAPAPAEQKASPSETTDPSTLVVHSPTSAPPGTKRAATSDRQARRKADARKERRRGGPLVARAIAPRERTVARSEQPGPVPSQVPIVGPVIDLLTQ